MAKFSRTEIGSSYFKALHLNESFLTNSLLILLASEIITQTGTGKILVLWSA